jgi:hypothetical protein
MGHLTRVTKMRYTYKIFVTKPEGKRTFGRPEQIWKLILKK